ncbi:hypothetical protein EBR43_02780 [bacterium]|nr:hypothetical protein [bacterium]
MRKVEIRISGRKIEGYPTITRTVEFETLDEFIMKADAYIEDTDFGKVDCYVDNFDNIFNDDEVKVLEDDFFIVE